MNTKDLVGQVIVEIHFNRDQLQTSGTIPLEHAQAYLKLSNNVIISYPHHAEADLKQLDQIPGVATKIFPQSILKSIFKSSEFASIKHKKISGIWSGNDDFEGELCFLELEDDVYLVKGNMSPIGIGGAELFIFNSFEALKSKFQSSLEKIY